MACPKTSLGVNHGWSDWLVFPIPSPEFEFTIFFTTIWVTMSNALAWKCTCILYLSTVPSPFYYLPPILPVLSPPPSPTGTISGPTTTSPPEIFPSPPSSVPCPTTYVPSPLGPILSPPYIEPSPYMKLCSEPNYRYTSPHYICLKPTIVWATCGVFLKCFFHSCPLTLICFQFSHFV